MCKATFVHFKQYALLASDYQKETKIGWPAFDKNVNKHVPCILEKEQREKITKLRHNCFQICLHK